MSENQNSGNRSFEDRLFEKAAETAVVVGVTAGICFLFGMIIGGPPTAFGAAKAGAGCAAKICGVGA